MPRMASLARCVGFLGALIVVAGCGSAATNVAHPPSTLSTSGSTSLPGDRGANPIVLSDTSPSHLELGIFVMLGGYDAASRDQVMVELNFTSGGSIVRLVAGERIACGGHQVQGAGNTNWQISAASGETLTCTYISGATTATFSFTIPHAPVILTPHDQAQVARSATTTVTYSTDGPVFSVVALSTASKAFPSPSAVGSTSSTFDTHALAPGKGTIVLTQYLDQIGLHAPAFKAAQGHAQTIAQITVNWI